VSGELFYGINEWFIFAALLVLLFLATETGFKLGRRARSGIDEHTRSEITMIQAAVLGLLALLLGFTFSMSASRFDTRKQLILEESNAIGTTFLRARLLPEPRRTEVSNVLRRYVDVRIEFYMSGTDRIKLRQATDQTEQLHNELWSRAVAVAEKDPRAVTTGLFLQSLNEMIDLHAKRMAALDNHVPETIFMLLYVVSVLSMGLVGYGCGLGTRRNLLATMTAAFLVASVILLLVDLDRPRRGLIKTGHKSMVNLRDSLKKTSP
jgi:hypothetical protein